MNRVQKLMRQPEVRGALASFREGVEQILEQTVTVQQIPAPTFAEEVRAAYVESSFQGAGLFDVHQDSLHNVYGCFVGRQPELAPVVISAHSDTVFAADLDLSVRRNGKRLYGPGIADNSLGVAALLLLARALRQWHIKPGRSIWFVANVGEEGLGNLHGMRAVVDRFGEAAAYIVLEGGLFGYICHQAIGVRRYQIEVETQGGHSWGSFGNPSAIHVLGQLITAIDNLKVPAVPKTTYNVGLIEGGTTINTIARSAHLLLDLRSEGPAELEQLVTRVETLVNAARRPGVEVRMKLIGDRPAGQIPRRHWLVNEAVAALQAVDFDGVEFTVGSTDANIPLSRGLPSVCIGITCSGNTHRPDEYLEMEPLASGLGQALLLLLAAAG